MAALLVFVAFVAIIAMSERHGGGRRVPAQLASPELGDLTVLRVVLDAAAIAELPAETSLQRLAATLRELRSRWRRAGATDFDTIPGGELRERFTAVLREEDERVRDVAPTDEGPFRAGDRREVVLVVLVIAAREYPALHAAGIDRALVAISGLPATQLVGAGVIAGRTTIADLGAAYSTDELRDV